MNSSLLGFIENQIVNNDAQSWREEIAVVIGLTGLLVAFLSVIRDALGWNLGSLLKARRLRRGFGASLYDPQEIKFWTRYYVRPEAASVDLAQEMEQGTNSFITREDLFHAIERFLDHTSGYRHMLLLADSGMGKSSFVTNFYDYNQQKWGRKHRLAVIPLAHPKAIAAIDAIEDKRDTIIFLDAFDEDPSARPRYWKRLHELMIACSEFKFVLITCRTQFFPKDDEVPTETGLIRIGPTSSETQYTFCRLYLAPLSDQQVDKYLRKLYPFWSRKLWRARELVKQVPVLTVRPMLLSYIPDIVASGTAIKTRWQLYEIMTSRWYEREKRTWKTIDAIEAFSEELAVQFYCNFLKGGSDRVSKSEIRMIFKQLSSEVDELIATSRSLLHRDAKGNLKFAHWSIMEFLFVKRFFARDKRCCHLRWTEQMKQFVVEIFRSADLRDHPIRKASLDGADLSGVDLSETDLSGGVKLRRVDLGGANLNHADLTGANLNEATLSGADLSGATLKGAYLIKANVCDADLSKTLSDDCSMGEGNFAGAKLNNASLKGTNLVGANFSSASLESANLEGAILCGAYFIDTSLNRANLTGADLSSAYLMRADLRYANLTDANFEDANIVGALFTAEQEVDHAAQLSKANRTGVPSGVFERMRSFQSRQV
jgi:uncharacterized protein YjbI with pentapeptide repeats